MDGIKSHYRWVLPIAAIFITLLGAKAAGLFGTTYGPVMSAGISDDGRYIISSHRSSHLVLWDIKKERYKALADDANIYSAFFISGQHAFLWQNHSNVVTVQTVDGETLEQFQHFPTYGHAMDASLAHYLSATESWSLFHGHGDSLKPILRDGDSPSLTGSGKLLNLSLSGSDFFITAGKGLDFIDERPISDNTPAIRPTNNQLSSSNFSGVVLWSYETLSPVHKFSGNSSKTHATISPDGQWVVSSDEAGIGLYWNTDAPDERHRLARFYGGVFQDNLPEGLPDSDYYDNSKLIDAPPGLNDFTIAVAFIHNSEYYLRFGNNSHIAALFKTGSPWPVKYFDLGESPELVTYGSQYDRNTAIATSPEAGILAMGHKAGGGISVYQFDPDELALERVWVVE
ncbi:WD40 repeat domain-containing protein [Marinobacter sp. 1_MG-2023]|uniref:WD40 repeat domain-containing protein n=1 Tax=Marinobacter sp. 1_MG-2023 TaxID=3062627 RepID=UPI0026E2FF1B|nr:WD40 repeat domain-containing protein [Marinobacter sp. 1_MG-2023]MDO6824062.1 WD40 repeat domain-containing protein [Marinobacter sp. 1_MG-2023]